MLGNFLPYLFTFILILGAGCQSPIDKITDKFGPPTRIDGSGETRFYIYKLNRASHGIDVHTYKVKGGKILDHQMVNKPVPTDHQPKVHDPTQCECSLCMYANQAW